MDILMYSNRLLFEYRALYLLTTGCMMTTNMTALAIISFPYQVKLWAWYMSTTCVADVAFSGVLSSRTRRNLGVGLGVRVRVRV